MILKYLGKTKNFKYLDYDFSKGPCEVSDAKATILLVENPRTFAQVKPKIAVKPKVMAIKSKGTAAGSKATVKPEAA